MTWLNFVGRSYYDLGTFVREAKGCGVTRRVSLAVLKRMTWGDKVYLAMHHKRTGSLLFGCFYVYRISGLSPEATQAVRERFQHECMFEGGAVVERECGLYITGPSYTVQARIDEILETIKDVKDPGKPMVGGPFCPLTRVRLHDVPFTRGFRPFDEDKFTTALTAAESPSSKMQTVRGLFYVFRKTEPPKPPPAAGEVQEVRSYRRRD